MADLYQMLEARLPDEAALFSGSIDTLIEEAKAIEGFEGVADADLTTLQASLIADQVAKALILPAMSHYKKALAKAERDGAGTAEWADKLQFLNQMKAELAASIIDKRGRIAASTDTGVPLVVVPGDDA